MTTASSFPWKLLLFGHIGATGPDCVYRRDRGMYWDFNHQSSSNEKTAEARVRMTFHLRTLRKISMESSEQNFQFPQNEHPKILFF